MISIYVVFFILRNLFILSLNDEMSVSYRYIGHLKERTLKEQMERDPTEAIRKAVLRMLPRNKLRDVSITVYKFSGYIFL